MKFMIDFYTLYWVKLVMRNMSYKRVWQSVPFTLRGGYGSIYVAMLFITSFVPGTLSYAHRGSVSMANSGMYIYTLILRQCVFHKGSV
jgi:hypothetical protein